METIKRKFVTLIISTLLCLSAAAQPDWDDDPDDVPIGGGIALLIIAGATLGSRNFENSEN